MKNHKITGMWSAPGEVTSDGRPVVKFSDTSNQFCSFRVMLAPEGKRLYVLNPYSGGYFWIDADAVGPVSGEPEHRPAPKPTGQNCSEFIHDGQADSRPPPSKPNVLQELRECSGNDVVINRYWSDGKKEQVRVIGKSPGECGVPDRIPLQELRECSGNDVVINRYWSDGTKEQVRFIGRSPGECGVPFR